MVLLDTHIWLWWLLGDGNLTDTERFALDELATKRHISISWVTIWETEMLERKKRIRLEPDFKTWIEEATHPSVSAILPVDTEVVIAQRRLPENFHADPADRLITATALLTGFKIATYDRRIIDSAIVSIWKP